MTPRVVLATRNAGKVAELRRILDAAGLDVELVGAEAFAALPDVAETGTTFAANALLKARAVAAYTGLPSIADDSGLCVDALNGMPGILSARWAGRHGDDEANLDLLLAQLSDTPDERRGAHFFCAAAVAMPPVTTASRGSAASSRARSTARCIRERRGTGGFGYDPIFVPYGSARTTAEMDAAEKDAISHRGQAFRAPGPGARGAAGPPRTARSCRVVADSAPSPGRRQRTRTGRIRLAADPRARDATRPPFSSPREGHSGGSREWTIRRPLDAAEKGGFACVLNRLEAEGSSSLIPGYPMPAPRAGGGT